MKKLFVFILTALLALPSLSQNVRVSQKIADAISNGKYYMKLQGIDVEGSDEEASYRSEVEQNSLEIACKPGASMVRVITGGTSIATLTANGKTWMLTESVKMWMALPSVGGMMKAPSGKLTYKRQGTCKVNGQLYYFDEYSATDGVTITFCYNSDKVSVVDFGSAGGTGVLLSFSKGIPDNMYFCIGKGWKGRGMPAPPQCAIPWKDKDAFAELAAGRVDMAKAIITDKQVSANAIWLAQFSGSSPGPAAAESAPMCGHYTVEGVEKAVKELTGKLQGKTDEEVEKCLIDACNRDMALVIANQVTGSVVEEAIARMMILPHPIVINNAAVCLLVTDDYKEAEVLTEEALKMAPDNPILVDNLAEACLNQEKYEKAHKVLTKIINLYTRGELFEKLALSLLGKGDQIGAINAFIKALSLGHCDQIVAGAMFQTYKGMLKALGNPKTAAEGGELFLKIFSDENVHLLKKAAAYEGEEVGRGVGEYDFKWPFKPGSIESTCESLLQSESKVSEWVDQYSAKATVEDSTTQLRLGLHNDTQTPISILDEPYTDETEAPRYWGMFMLDFYYFAKVDLVTGHWSEDLQDAGHNLAGWFMPEYKKYFQTRRTYEDRLSKRLEENDNIRQNKDKPLEKQIEDLQEQMKHTLDEARLKAIVKKIAILNGEILWNLVDCCRADYQATSQLEIDGVIEAENYWTNYIKPAIDDYWKMTDEYARYLGNDEARRHFVNVMKANVFSPYVYTWQEGHRGQTICNARQAWKSALEVYENYMESIDVEKDERAEKDRERIETYLKDMAYLQMKEDMGEDPLKKYEEKETVWPDFNITIGNSDISRFSLSFGMHGNRGFLEVTDKKQGLTRGWVPGAHRSYIRVNEEAYVRTNGGGQNAWEKRAQDATKDKIVGTLTGKIPVASDLMNYAKWASNPIDVNKTNERTYLYDEKGQLLRVGKRESATVTPALGNVSMTQTVDRSNHYGRGVTGTVTKVNRQMNINILGGAVSASGGIRPF